MNPNHLKLWLLANSTLIIIFSLSTSLLTLTLWASSSHSTNPATETAVLSLTVLLVGISGCAAMTRHKYTNLIFCVYLIGNVGLTGGCLYLAVSTLSEGSNLSINILGGLFVFLAFVFLQNLLVVYLICTHPQREDIFFDFKSVKLLNRAPASLNEEKHGNKSEGKTSLSKEIKKKKKNVNEKPTVYTELPDQSIRIHDDRLDISQI